MGIDPLHAHWCERSVTRWEAAALHPVHAASRAQTAADASALAAAQALAIDEEGPEPAALAGEYAERNGAVLETCSCERGTFEATVSVRLPVGDLFLVAGDRTVLARARAQVDLPS
jgi:hypothetical protein